VGKYIPSNKKFLVLTVSSMCLLVFLGFYTRETNGKNLALKPENYQGTKSNKQMHRIDIKSISEGPFQIGNLKEQNCDHLIIGDSHLGMVLPTLKSLSIEKNKRLDLYILSGDNFLYGYKGKDNLSAFDELVKYYNKNGKYKYKNVTIVGSWLFHIDQLKMQKLNVINSFQEVINWFNQMGSKVNIIYDIPTFKGTWPCKYNF